jgi:predicted GNAT family acetyltransferase
MEVHRVRDPSEFIAAASPLLLEDEARHNLILGLAGTLRDRPGYYPDFVLWLVEDSGEVVGAALRTRPFNVVLARPAVDDAIAVLAHALVKDEPDLSGVIAAVPEVDAFAEAWESRRGATRRLRMANRVYQLVRVRPPADVPGRARPATAPDRELLVAWLEAFANEIAADAPSPASDGERTVDARLAGPDSGFLLWEHEDEPVSMAGWGSPTPSGIRIGPVYTPPARRSRGYGSAVTAAVSAEQLAGGRRFCFLYTDLANPTSNRIYVDIGYEPVCDALDYAFETTP